MMRAVSFASFLVGAFFVGTAGVRADLATGLTHYWSFDHSGATTTLVDSVGANSGTLQNYAVSSWTIGRFGNALSFDGVDDQVSLGNIAGGVTGLSVGGWVKLENLPSTQPEAFSGIFESAADAFVLYADKGNSELRFKVTDQEFDAARPGIAQSSLSTGTWMHIMGVFEGTSNRASIYLNGQFIEQHFGDDGNGDQLGTLLALQETYFGSQGGSFFLKGALDDFAVWNRVLSFSEIGQLQSASVGQLTAVPEASPLALCCGVTLAAIGCALVRRVPVRV